MLLIKPADKLLLFVPFSVACIFRLVKKHPSDAVTEVFLVEKKLGNAFNLHDSFLESLFLFYEQ